MVILCDYAGCERPAVCRIKVGEHHVYYCELDLLRVEQRFGRRPVEALHDNTDQAAPIPSGVPLTRREVEVLQAAAAGLGNHEIADQLHLSTETVKSHTRHLHEKLGARNKAHAVSIAYQHGLLKIVDRG